MSKRKDLRIDVEDVRKLAQCGATQLDMARYFGVSLRTMVSRLASPKYAGVYEQGQGQLDVSLRQKQVALALSGDKTMLIWLGKQRLGQKDRVEHSGTGSEGAIDVNVSIRELLVSRIDRLAERKRASGNIPGAD